MAVKKKCEEVAGKILTWSQSFSVGAPLLDRQHQFLFDIINRLRAACAQNLAQEDILEIIRQLYTYSATHFKDEEVLLEKKGCNLLGEQQTHHAIFLDYVIELEQKTKINAAHVDEDVLTFLDTWWQEHILKVDMQYSKFF